MEQEIIDYEKEMWNSAKCRDVKKFLELVSENAVIVYAGFHCTGLAYSDFIAKFELEHYHISSIRLVADTPDLCQILYTIQIHITKAEYRDLAGTYQATSTWRYLDGTWKIIFHMDTKFDNGYLD